MNNTVSLTIKTVTKKRHLKSCLGLPYNFPSSCMIILKNGCIHVHDAVYVANPDSITRGGRNGGGGGVKMLKTEKFVAPKSLIFCKILGRGRGRGRDRGMRWRGQGGKGGVAGGILTISYSNHIMFFHRLWE